MNQYLLSVYEADGKVEGAPMTPEDMQSFMQRVSLVGRAWLHSGLSDDSDPSRHLDVVDQVQHREHLLLTEEAGVWKPAAGA